MKKIGVILGILVIIASLLWIHSVLTSSHAQQEACIKKAAAKQKSLLPFADKIGKKYTPRLKQWVLDQLQYDYNQDVKLCKTEYRW